MDDLQIATYSYGEIMQCSIETRRILLRKIFLHAPRHAKELRELKEFECTGFCSRSFTSDASDRVRSLTYRMILASLGTQCRGEARSRGFKVVNGSRSSL